MSVEDSKMKPMKKDWSIYGGRTLITLSLIYCAQGLWTFTYVAEVLYFKNKFNLDPTETTLATTITYLSWWVKPIYGLISDCITINGYHKKPYIFILGLTGLISCISILLSDNLILSILLMLLCEISQTFVDVLCDGYMVEKSRLDPINGANDLQKVCWGSYYLSSAFGILIGGLTADYVKPKYLFGFVSICPLLAIISSFVIDEKPDEESYSISDSCMKIRENASLLYDEVKKPKILRIILFTILWQGTLLWFGSIYTYFLYNILYVLPSTVSYYTISIYLGGFIATVFASKQLLQWPLLFKLVLGRFLYLSTVSFDIIVVTKYYESLGIPFYYFLLGSYTLGSTIWTLFSQLPLLVVYAKITPKHIEATFFSMMLSMINIGYSVSEFMVSFLMTVTEINDEHSPHLWILSAITIILGIISLSVIYILPEDVRMFIPKENDKEEELSKKLEEPLIDRNR